MKPFESFLAAQLTEYLAYRQGLGYAIKTTEAQLRVFDRHLKRRQADWTSFEPAFFLEMTAGLNTQSITVNRIVSTVRVFFRFLVRCGYLEENPVKDIPPLKENTIVPFVFSPGQVDQFLEVICTKIRKTKGRFPTDFALYLALMLLARCGMRISEPLRLMLHHYRRDDATIYIEKSKFKKNRLLPVPKAVSVEIDNYLSVRQSLRPDDHNPYLLAGRGKRPLTDAQIRRLFHIGVKKMGINQPRRIIGNVNFSQPTPHSLRHSFAVNTLIRIKERGESAQNALPALAAYMGHSDYKHTSVYLRVADAASRQHLVDFALWQKKNI
jgi:site-specific recombinase XerD